MRAIKKIVALATGATMVGATIMGAMAADLANYPAPFVEGCTFSGAIVVGANAAAEDVVGGMDIIASLAQSGTQSSTSSGTTVSASGESVKIETNTKKLTLGSTYNNIIDVKSTDLDGDDLPTILAAGTYTADDNAEYGYEQKIKFSATVALDFNEDSNYNDKENVLRVYANKNTNLLNYTLDFTKDVECDVSGSTISDLDDTTISMLGKTYDITAATNSSTDITLTLMGGAIKDILEQGQSKTYTLNEKEYEVEVTYIGGTTSKVKFKVNGEVSDLMANDDTWKTTDGTTIGVREIMEEEAGEVDADKVEFYLGAEKLTLADTSISAEAGKNDKKDNVQLSDEDVEGLFVDIVNTTANKLTLDKIVISWFPDDEVFVTEEQDAEFPLGGLKISYEGFTTPAAEEIIVQNNGDQEIELVVPIKSGTATIPLLATNTTHFDAIGGEGVAEGLLTSNGTNPDAAYGPGRTVTWNTSKYEYMVISSQGAEESYLIEVSDVDDDDGVDLKDAVSGVKYENKRNGTTFTIGDVSLTVDHLEEDLEDGGNFSLTGGADVYFDRVYSVQGLTVMLPINGTAATIDPKALIRHSLSLNITGNKPTTYVLNFIEEDRNEGIATATGVGSGKVFNLTLGISSAKTSVTALDKDALVNSNYFEIGSTDEFEAYVASDIGTHIYYDTDPDQNSVKIIYHGGESYGNVFVSELEASFGKVDGGTGTAICKVAIPPALLDSEVSSVSAQNLILLGGPCANTAAAEVMGNPADCTEGFEEGKAMIKLYDTGAGKVALLVAGMSALDTRRAASTVLANYGDYALSGAEVEAVGTGKSVTSVNKVA